MSTSRSNTIISISTRLNSKLSNLDLDSEEQILSILNDVDDLLKLKHAKLEKLQITHDKVESKYRELTAETEELKLQIKAMEREIQLEKASQESLMEEAKRLKLDTMIFDSIVAALASRGLLPPDF
ncbi:uncharacterized protein LOC129293298 [Prosopis cineraria]|uniref:uncharacterized protein LOC129293298 n=1 Tax=Prosopis cineraria TaxID=364024 RepID=UPI0024104304|nr:uncharacterized protein LOC129293298 [Prosopis cineraria]